MPIDKDEYDVFGDGKAMIKAAPGHTPGHQVLVLSLASTGRIMIAGDLYHYPPEREFHRAPPDNEFDVQQSAASRAQDRGVPEEDQDRDLDRARVRGEREAEEVARVLRVNRAEARFCDVMTNVTPVLPACRRSP